MNISSFKEGSQMYDLASRLFDICRSITGDGVRQTLNIIHEQIPDLTIHEIPSGTQCFDWVIPDEWNIHDAYIMKKNGEKVVDFKVNNLHVVGYSIPINKEMTLSELQEHLFSLPEQPNAIPYITSYYQRSWGFCLTENQRKQLTDPIYHVVIDSDLKPGNLTYADMVIPGESDKEVFFSTYTCHPSMANNELSGPVLATCLAKWLQTQNNSYTYRFVFAPETIGPLVYLKEHLKHLREKTIAAFNLTCVGDNRATSFLPSRDGRTLTDRVARHIVEHLAPEHIEYSFIHDRASDERQYCSPGVDLPMVSIMRTKYGNYPEYHTSLDDLSVICPEGLQKSFDIHKECIKLLEANRTYRTTITGEPQLSRSGLVVQRGGGTTPNALRFMIQNLLMYSDGTMDLLTFAEKMDIYAKKLFPVIEILLKEKLIREVQKNS